jgi:hypothetical protein
MGRSLFLSLCFFALPVAAEANAAPMRAAASGRRSSGGVRHPGLERLLHRFILQAGSVDRSARLFATRDQNQNAAPRHPAY